MTQSPQSVFNKVYADANGEPTLPPLAKSMLRDNRLRPDETRELVFELPPSVTTAELELTYRLLPPPAAKKMGLEAPDLTKAVTVARAVVTRDPR